MVWVGYTIRIHFVSILALENIGIVLAVDSDSNNPEHIKTARLLELIAMGIHVFVFRTNAKNTPLATIPDNILVEISFYIAVTYEQHLFVCILINSGPLTKENSPNQLDKSPKTIIEICKFSE